MNVIRKELKKIREHDVDKVTKTYWSYGGEIISEFLHKNLHKGNYFLDVGCGTGDYLISMAEKGVECFGIDPLYNLSIKKLQKRAANEKVTIFAILGIGESLPFLDCSFDVILCASTLQHVGDYNRVLDEIRRTLKTDGKFIVSVPMHRKGLLPPSYTYGFDLKGLSKILRKHFEIKKREDIGFFPWGSHKFLAITSRLNPMLFELTFRCFNFFAKLFPSLAANVVMLCTIRRSSKHEHSEN